MNQLDESMTLFRSLKSDELEMYRYHLLCVPAAYFGMQVSLTQFAKELCKSISAVKFNKKHIHLFFPDENLELKPEKIFQTPPEVMKRVVSP